MNSFNVGVNKKQLILLSDNPFEWEKEGNGTQQYRLKLLLVNLAFFLLWSNMWLL